VANLFGLINYYVPHEELATTARVLAAKLAAGPVEAHAVTKRMLNRELHLDLAAAIEAEAVAQAACMQTEAFRKAARRYGTE
jgi:enoyl-CoA hydratase/carnithine racemase